MTHLAALHWIFSRASISFAVYGSQTGAAYSRSGQTRALYAVSFVFLLPILRLRWIKPRVLLALLVMESIWDSHCMLS